MTKQTKMIIAIGAVALGGYLFYKKTQNKSFANLTAAPDCSSEVGTAGTGKCQCPCKNTVGSAKDGTTLCGNGHTCCNGLVGSCKDKSNKI